MGAATYRIGPSDLFLPGDLKADADTLDGQIHSLDDAINGNESIPQETWDAFQIFESNWRGFYSSSFGGFLTNLATAINDSNRDQLISYENQFLQWTSTLGHFGAQIPGPLIQPSKGSGDTLKIPGLPDIDVTTALVVVLLIVIAWKVL